MMFRAFLTATAILLTGPATAQVFDTEKGRINVATVAGGLEQPWGIDFLPDGRMIVTEKPGQLRIVTADGKISPPHQGCADGR
jgi:glucose/arabinose dehydrogenase